MTLREISFRDGTRVIPEHLAVRMAGLDTTTLTYDQAVKKADDYVVRDYLNKLQAKAIAEHMRNLHR